MMQDWVHDNTSIAFKQELGRSIPLADSILLGGTNTFKCDALNSSCCSGCDLSKCTPGTDEAFCCKPDERCYRPTLLPNGTIIEQKQIGGLFNRTFQEGKRYLLQLINASADAMFIFAIDDHDLLVIASDLVPIHPYKTDSLFIAIGGSFLSMAVGSTNFDQASDTKSSSPPSQRKSRLPAWRTSSSATTGSERGSLQVVAMSHKTTKRLESFSTARIEALVLSLTPKLIPIVRSVEMKRLRTCVRSCRGMRLI